MILRVLFFITACSTFAIADEPLLLKQNGGWCWYQDERAIIDGDRVIFGSVSSPQGHVEVTSWNMKTGETRSFTLHEQLQSDDHNLPALLKRKDERYLAIYSKHGNDPLMRWRITTQPGDIREWTEERTQDVGAGNTYSNLFQLPDGTMYNFHRGVGWNPNYMISNDDGESWRYGGRLIAFEGRPYVKYAQHGERIHFITTEHHPHNYHNSIYHGYIENSVIHRSDGTPIADLSRMQEASVAPEDLTCIFAGDENNIAWTVDLHVDESGAPVAAFSVRKNGDIEDHRYHYARWIDGGWIVNEIAYAGSNLYDTEKDYTGLMAIDPQNTSRVFISTDSDPESGEALISSANNQRHYEIYRGISSDNGASWSWTAITKDSREDNLRPIVPIGPPGRGALLWLRGDYRSYTDYDLNVMGMRIGR